MQKIKASNNTKSEKIYNLEERSKKYFERVILLCKGIKYSPLTKRVIEQLVAASGSVGANYLEATGGMSRKDFVRGLKIARKEAKECTIWLHGLKVAEASGNPEFDNLIQEAKEFVYIFTSILEKTDKK